jgi:hypothetical protein
MKNMNSRNKVVPVGMVDYLLKKAEYLDKQRTSRQLKMFAALNLVNLYEPKHLADQGKQSYRIFFYMLPP